MRHILTSFLLFTGISAFAQYNDPNFAIPASGYGSDGSHTVTSISFANPNFPTKDIEVYYPSDVSGRVPTIFYSHAYGGNSSSNVAGMLNFVAKKGYAIVFVPYQTVGVTVDERYTNLLNGFRMAARNYSIIDTTRVGFMGHSFGGGASFGLAYTAITENDWGANGRFVYALAQWYSDNIAQSALQNYPADVKVLVEIFNDDVTNDHRMAIDIFNTISVTAAEKDFLLVKASTVNGYTYVVDHVVPNNTIFDALDYYAYYRFIDALCDYTFNSSTAGKDMALGNGSAAQVTMPTGMTSLEQTDVPVVVFPEDKYQFPCSDAQNLRSAYCPQIVTAVSNTQNSQQISLYPNPVKDHLIIELPTGTEALFVIRNVYGEEIARGVGSISELDVTGFPAGLYFISSGSWSAKFVKE